MTRAKFFAAYYIMVMLFGVLILRVYFVATDDELYKSARAQGSVDIELYTERPDFLYADGSRITGTARYEAAVIVPTGDAVETAALFAARSDPEVDGLPYLARVNAGVQGAPFRTVNVRERYGGKQAAAHLVGYLGYDGEGVSGLEGAMDEYLADASSVTTMTVGVDALGRSVYSAAAEVTAEGGDSADVTLTLHREVQQACEAVADEYLERGAIVVLDTKTGAVCGMVSRPDFDAGDIAASLGEEGSPFLNRALSAYNVGSVYKPLLAAAALEAGTSVWYSHDCTGQIETASGVYTCNNSTVHELLYMGDALCRSCNVYFIDLGEWIGEEAVYNLACSAGLGRRTPLWEDFGAGEGYLPTLTELAQPGEFVNHCFGQGKLLATPLQVAAMTNCFANGGYYTEPWVVAALGDERQQASQPVRIMSQSTADTVAGWLADTIVEGTGINADPYLTTAAGKTGTAQTGRYKQDGSEVVIGWFTGFFPVDEPRYTVAVMTEDAGYGYETAASAFRALADLVTALEP